MQRVFISQSMNGRSEDEILKERNILVERVKEHFLGEKLDVLDTYFKDFKGNSLQYLAKSIEALAIADIAVFGQGWQDARGCRIEHECCVKYGITVIVT